MVPSLRPNDREALATVLCKWIGKFSAAKRKAVNICSVTLYPLTTASSVMCDVFDLDPVVFKRNSLHFSSVNVHRFCASTMRISVSTKIVESLITRFNNF